MDEADARDTGRLALAIGVVAVGSAVCLTTYFVVGGPFGTFNDIGNAGTGVLSAALAWRLRRHLTGRARDLAVAAAIVGAAIAVVGSALVVSGTTGWFLAGLVSTVGFAGVGAWLVVLNQGTDATVAWPRRLRWLGIIAGALMVVGIVALPGVLLGLDDSDGAPAWAWLAFIGWLGIYVAYPAWSIWLGIVETGRARRTLGSGELRGSIESKEASSWTGG
jgi:hypothetical protein